MISLGLHIITLQFNLEKSKRTVLLQLNTLRLPKMPLGRPVGMTLKLDYWDER